MSETLSLLLLADSHIGFDQPTRPRVARRFRGPDFLANLERALDLARERRVDLIVHGGDVFHRSKPTAAVASAAYDLLLDVANDGIPLLVTPGNHERGRLPYRLWATHPNLHVFDRPRTVHLEVRGTRLAVAGFPFVRAIGGDRFPALLEEAGLWKTSADVRLVCCHQAFAGATVGAHDYTFRQGPDVVPATALPRGVAAVLSGHIHRAQVLRSTRSGVQLPCPVVYPGSLERTAFAERLEPKGCMLLELTGGGEGGRLLNTHFVQLPTRPMMAIACGPTPGVPLAESLARRLRSCPTNAIVYVTVHGELSPETTGPMSARWFREVAPHLSVIGRQDPPGTWRVDS